MTDITLSIDSASLSGAPRAGSLVDVLLIDGGSGGSDGERVIHGRSSVVLDDEGHGSIVLPRNSALDPAGTHYEITTGTITRRVAFDDETPDAVTWADESIQVEAIDAATSISLRFANDTFQLIDPSTVIANLTAKLIEFGTSPESAAEVAYYASQALSGQFVEPTDVRKALLNIDHALLSFAAVTNSQMIQTGQGLQTLVDAVGSPELPGMFSTTGFEAGARPILEMAGLDEETITGIIAGVSAQLTLILAYQEPTSISQVLTNLQRVMLILLIKSGGGAPETFLPDAYRMLDASRFFTSLVDEVKAATSFTISQEDAEALVTNELGWMDDGLLIDDPADGNSVNLNIDAILLAVTARFLRTQQQTYNQQGQIDTLVANVATLQSDLAAALDRITALESA